ncbi:MAG: hypothetical protein ACI8P9_004934 [Parasphingorhabdus sp.]
MGDALFDVQKDPDETCNLIDNPECSSIAAELAAKIDKFFDQHAAKKADLWHGGQPVQNAIRADFWRESWGEGWNPFYEYTADKDA